MKGATGRAIAMVAVLLVTLPGTVAGKHYTAWGEAAPEPNINSTAPDGCPIESPDGLSLYIASTRVGTLGGNDIWVATRNSLDEPFGTPQNLGEPVNSLANDFCPTPLRGGWLLFVSDRTGDDTCGAGPGKGDMYIVRQDPKGHWGVPQHLGCNPTGPNFPGAEFGPSLVETELGTQLYFSSEGYGSDMNIYVSMQRADGSFAPATLVTELNTPAADTMPNVRKDGLEIVFSSNRPGSTLNAAGLPSQDVYTATRATVADPWLGPVNLGLNVNTGGNETRSSLSGDGERLHFGRDGEIYVSYRSKVRGSS